MERILNRIDKARNPLAPILILLSLAGYVTFLIVFPPAPMSLLITAPIAFAGAVLMLFSMSWIAVILINRRSY